MIILFAIGFLLYVTSAWLSYHNSTAWWTYAIISIVGIGTNVLWLKISRTAPSKEMITIYGMYWDAMITGVFIVYPLIIAGVRLAPMQIFGIITVIAGIAMTKM